ncbi:MAG: homocysteine S-methyltransferase family protein [Candidatus Aminicenantes bacterium]|nr:homocysteine S-methyltransferase family protein [Candidatus Aminicenantes bacterium]
MTLPLLDVVKTRTVLLDGAMGTELMARGLPQGTAPEAWNIERPDVVKEIHGEYFTAGADVVSTNSFGGSALKLAGHGLGGRTYELNLASARLARDVAPAGRYVAGSMGPTGKFLKPQGEFTEEEFAAAYAEQARGLADGGVDVLLVETQYDLREALTAVRGARSVSSLPVFVTMTFNSFPRGFFTLMGDSVVRSAAELEKEGVGAVGANCTLNSEQMVGCVRAFREATTLPIIAQANAGQPVIGPDGRVAYSQGLEDYVRFVLEIVRSGAGLVGGCCGTNPSFTRAMARKLSKESS